MRAERHLFGPRATFAAATVPRLKVGANAWATFQPTAVDVFAAVVYVVFGEVVAALEARARSPVGLLVHERIYKLVMS